MPQRTPQNALTEFKGLADWIEIFKSGEQTDSRGRKQTFTHADLDQIVANTGTANPVPHRITHKSLFSPFAYAQGVEAKRDGDSLYIKSDKIEPQFEKLIKDGRLYERSVGIRKSDKGWKLDHIAWLGAEPPAVDGLAPVEFESGDDVYEFTLSDHPDARWAFDILAQNLRNMRDWMIDKFDLETADRVVPDYHVDAVKRASEVPNDSGNTPEFNSMYSHPQHNFTKTPQSGPDSPLPRTGKSAMVNHDTTADGGTNVNDKTNNFSQQDIDAAVAEEKQQREIIEKTLKDERKKNRLKEFQAQVDQFVADGKLVPAQAEGMAEFMLSQADDSEQFEFSGGEGNNAESIKESRDAWFTRFVDSLTPHQLDKTSDAGDQETEHQFQMPAGSESADAADQALFQRAKQYQAEHGGEFMAAYRAVGGE